MSQGDSRNSAHLGPNLPSNHKIAMSSDEASDTTNLVKISRNIFISNGLSFFQILMGMLSLKFAIVNHGVPENLMRLLHKPLKSITNQIWSILGQSIICMKRKYMGPRFASLK